MERSREELIVKLNSLGFDELTPMIKLGFEKLNSDRFEVIETVDGLTKTIPRDAITDCETLPALGQFGEPRSEDPAFDPPRLVELMRKFNGLIGKSGGPSGENGFDALRRVFATVNLLHGQFNSFRRYTSRIPKEAELSRV